MNKPYPIFNGAKSTGKQWFSVKNLATEPAAEILIYDQIGKDWWSGEGIGAKDFIDEVNQIPKGRNITMRINSNGGNVHDGLAIYNYLQTRKDEVSCIVDGVAASIASIIALAGSSLEMPRNALMMIHEPWTMAEGNADEMRKAADALDKHRDSLVTIYEAKTGKSKAEIEAALKAETWFTGDEAKAFGLCNTVTNELPAMACSHLDFSNFRLVPDSLRASNPKQPAAPSGTPTPNPQDTMNKEKIIALLKDKGIEIPKDATEEQLMNLLTSAVNAKAEPVKAAAVVDPNAELIAEMKAMRAERDAAKKSSIKAALTQCANEFRIPLNSVDKWAEACIKDESILAEIQAMQSNAPAEPVAMTVEITNESPESFNAAFKKLNAPFSAFIKHGTGNGAAMKDAAHARACFITKNAGRIGQIVNTNSVDTNLKRQVILQEGIRAFRRKLIALRAFCTVFESVPLQGTDKVTIPYHALQSVASTAWNASNGYVAGDTADSYKEITIDQRYYQGFDFSSQTLRRQPYFDFAKHVVLKSEKLALDVVQAAMAKITTASFGAAVVTSPASAFDRDDIADLRGAANTANWPEMARSLFLSTDYDTNLLKDSKLVDADKSGSDAAMTGILGKLLGFDYYGGNNYIPDNSENLSGFIAWRSALLFATAPIMPAPAVMADLASYDVVVDEQSGVAFEYRSFGDAQLDVESHFVECNYGAVAGEAAALKRIVSQA